MDIALISPLIIFWEISSRGGNTAFEVLVVEPGLWKIEV
jgi:hypothetical protein